MHQVVAWIGVCARGVRANGRTGTAIIAMFGALCAAVLLSWPAVAQAQSWQYVYDEVGRLKAAIAPNGDRADYEYDAVGNIIAIRRSAAGALDISEFTPQIGKSGTVVKITGSGFSTTLASNVVKFNGVTATVTAATATQLTVTAPATGSTGPISVTVGANTVTSRESFVYSSTTRHRRADHCNGHTDVRRAGRHGCVDRHQLRCCTRRHACRARQRGGADHGHQSDGAVVCSPAGRHFCIARRDGPRHLGYFNPTLGAPSGGLRGLRSAGAARA